MRRRDFLKAAAAAAVAAAGGYLLTRNRSKKVDVVIVGGGVAGSTVARLLPRDLDVVVVEKRSSYLVGPAKEDVALGLASPVEYAVGFANYVRGEVLAVDPGNRLVYTTAGVFQYKYLVLAPGVRLAYEAVAVDRGARYVNIYDDDNVLASAGVLKRARGRVVVAHPGLPYRCTSAPYETAFLLKWLNPEADVTVISGVKEIPREFVDQVSTLGGRVAELMEERGIDFVGGLEVVEIWRDRVVTDGGEVFKYDALIWTPPHRGWGLLVEAGLAREGEYSFVRVDDEMRALGWDDVYAVGDVVWHVVKTGWAAFYQAQVAAASIKRDLGLPAEGPRFLYSEDAIRLSPREAIRGAKAWWPIYGGVLWRGVYGPSEAEAEAKYQWMRAMKEIIEEGQRRWKKL
ncbi:FAD-dependent oxidoreductase [Pyrobaculum ferrireducens]|uniref:Flavoprotein reductase, conjectural n=1 Tax=Pyrobaculum ferrireducens TaxID=1104324 RepID=G7VHI1_9CREN|nr:FAD/NAD(P)-binding oxidoreductase [Pyrobaculum ferrireducens]AET33272.1 flavoprotein reductase, conjectural [Pyrobaculum ferrireducens]